MGSVELMAESSQTLERGIMLLHLVNRDRPGGWTVTDLAAELGVGRPVVYRLLTGLEKFDLVRRNDSGHVLLGIGVLRLSTGLHPTLSALAADELHQLADELGATAHLTVAHNGEAEAIAVVEPSWTSFHMAYRVGSRHPVTEGAAGKAIIRGRTGEADAVSTVGELQYGAHGMAAPIIGVPGLEASVGVVSPHQFESAIAGPRLVTAAGRIAASLIGR